MYKSECFKILGTTEISSQIEKIITEESKFLIIVSPYLKINKRLKPKMIEGFKKIDKVLFIFRKDEKTLNEPEDYQWLKSISNVELATVENLHSKIYLNSEKCMIASMNLYEYSQINNYEIGVYFTSKKSKEQFVDVLTEIKYMLIDSNLSFDFNKILDDYLDFTIGALFNYIMTKYNLSNWKTDSAYYIKFCEHIRKNKSFSDDELYQIESGIIILKRIKLDREIFERLQKEIKPDDFKLI